MRAASPRSADLIAADAAFVEIVKGRGETPAARAFSLVAQGDWASYGAALPRGVDPTPIENIDTLKRVRASAASGAAVRARPGPGA